ncbi:hypothetical protein [Pseudomonas sp. C9-3]|uniref:hypothetical protein n=1 Tax=Pseudomonas sp. C9-3 TaxID=3078264 RepID=UPI0028EA0E1F|nr:hypothetical protein [Pseudomonas sp. C9-3]
MADLSELQGEVLALRCAVGALLSSIPLGQQLKVWPAFNHFSELVQDRMDDAGKAAFNHAVVRLSAMRQLGDAASMASGAPNA